MNKGDYLVIIAAFIIVLLMAVVVKPLLTGEEVVFLPKSPEPVIMQPGQTGIVQPEITMPVPVQTTPEMTVPPTPSVTEIGPTVTKTPEGSMWQPNPDMPMPSIQMVPYATLTSKYNGKTGTFLMPYPYWEIQYTVIPLGENPVFVLDVMEEGVQKDRLVRTITWRPGTEPDPKEGRFFEGGRYYYFVITAEELQEYTITISVPLKYIEEN
jgi:hypothetical protein